jgi:hypothetical protein
MYLCSVAIIVEAKLLCRNILSLEATFIYVRKATAMIRISGGDIYSMDEKRCRKLVAAGGKPDEEV